MGLLDDYEPEPVRPLPVVLLLDTSGSMRAEDKIDVLNQGVVEMVHELREVDSGLGCISLSLIAFGGASASVVHAHTPVADLAFNNLDASGKTPIGDAFRLARELIEDRAALPNRAYRPTIALISDGNPTDRDWEEQLDALITGERGAKATRFALAVGSDADLEMLTRFTGGFPPHSAGQAAEIRKFLQFVTTKVTRATRTAVRGGDPDFDDDSPDSLARLADDDAY
jgi:uncharacterized protein YegL